jgi:hypothetical protein
MQLYSWCVTIELKSRRAGELSAAAAAAATVPLAPRGRSRPDPHFRLDSFCFRSLAIDGRAGRRAGRVDKCARSGVASRPNRCLVCLVGWGKRSNQNRAT